MVYDIFFKNENGGMISNECFNTFLTLLEDYKFSIPGSISFKPQIYVRLEIIDPDVDIDFMKVCFLHMHREMKTVNFYISVFDSRSINLMLSKIIYKNGRMIQRDVGYPDFQTMEDALDDAVKLQKIAENTKIETELYNEIIRKES